MPRPLYLGDACRRLAAADPEAFRMLLAELQAHVSGDTVARWIHHEPDLYRDTPAVRLVCVGSTLRVMQEATGEQAEEEARLVGSAL